MNLLLFLLIVLPLLLLCMPRVGYPWLLAFCIPIYACMLWFATRPYASSDDWAPLGAFIVYLLFAVALAACALRLALSILLASRSAVSEKAVLDWKPFQFSCLLVLLVGFGWAWLPTMARLTTPLLVLILIGIAGVAAAWESWHARSTRRIAAGMVAVVAALGIGAIIVWPPIVVAAAERAAGGRPYCLGIANGRNGHREARSLIDLSPLMMRASEQGVRARNNHGQILVAGQHTRHWSYINRRFEADADTHRPYPCARHVGFAAQLPLF